MNLRDFTTTLCVNQTSEEAFKAINNPRGWWSENIEGSTDKLGDEWTYRNEDVHRCKLKVTELIPGKKVVWRVLDNYFNIIQDQKEWIGTDVTFEVSERDGNTEVSFTHVGLYPEYECFDVCSNAWDFYINTSLRNLIATGHGRPNQKKGLARIGGVSDRN
jgi:hypothetical protein